MEGRDEPALDPRLREMLEKRAALVEDVRRRLGAEPAGPLRDHLIVAVSNAERLVESMQLRSVVRQLDAVSSALEVLQVVQRTLQGPAGRKRE